MVAFRHHVRNTLWLLIVVATVLRLLIGWQLELSVDESYYYLYALYPDWSHFDHPPVVGLVIQLFTLDLMLDSELMLRLGPILFSAVNTYIAFRIGTLLSNEVAGLYAAFLYSASVYLSILAGIFIIPDAPQMLFWMLSLYLLLQCLPGKPPDRSAGIQMLAFGVLAGLAIYSKYHGIFLWVGTFMYILFYNRSWFARPELYLSGLISAMFIVPIFLWNLEHGFVSFGFHTERVTPELAVQPEYFLREVLGQILYNNPVNFFLIVTALVAWAKGRWKMPNQKLQILLFNALPLWAVFTAFSLFRPTLPHWSGPAYTPLIFIAAVYLSTKRKPGEKSTLVPPPLQWAVGLIALLSLMAVYVINYLPAGLGQQATTERYGDGDFTQDMYGWQQIASKFLRIRQRDIEEGVMPEGAPVVAFRYFPAAFYDYYFAVENGIDVLVLGPPGRAHNYMWINQKRGGLKTGEDAYALVVSNWYSDPRTDFGSYFEKIEPPEVIEIKKAGTVVRYLLVYRMRGYKGNFSFDRYW